MQRNEIELKADEVDFLRAYLKTGRKSKREYDRANILLLLHKGKIDVEIADILEVTTDYLLGDDRGAIKDVALLNQFQIVENKVN